jgi:hypothetical protein
MNPIRLRGPADILAALPFQLGYHPHDAVVVIALAGRAIGLVQRIDLPPEEHVAGAVSALLPALGREEPDAVLIVGYESQEAASLPVLDALDDACGALGITVLDRLVVRGGRWFAPDCTSGCCPAEGAPLPEPAETPAVADFVAMEMAPVRDRDALRTQLVPDGQRCQEVREALGNVVRRDSVDVVRRDSGDVPARPLVAVDGRVEAVRRLRSLARWAVVCDTSASRPPLEGLAPEEVAELALSLRDLALRDGLIAWLCPGSLPLDALDDDLVDQLRTCLPPQTWHSTPPSREAAVAGRRLQARLAQLCRMVPDEQAAPALTVLANLTWWLGDGALTRVALERALDVEPDYRLARLLARMVDLAIRPRASA